MLSSDLGKTKGRSRKLGSGGRLAYRIIFFLLSLAFLSASFYVILIRDFFLIKEVEVMGTRRISQEEIWGKIQRDQEGLWLNFIPKNNILFPWERWLGRKFKEEYRLIETFDLERIFPDKIRVEIEEKEPLMLMRGREMNCVFGSDGNHFDDISGFEYFGDNSISVISKNEGEPFDSCPIILGKEWLVFVADFRKGMEERGLALSRFWETPNLASGDLRVMTEAGWKIFLDKNLGVEKELEMLETVLQKKIEKEKQADLEYVDLRTQNRVYFRFKNSQPKESPEVNSEKKD